MSTHSDLQVLKVRTTQEASEREHLRLVLRQKSSKFAIWFAIGIVVLFFALDLRKHQSPSAMTWVLGGALITLVAYNWSKSRTDGLHQAMLPNSGYIFTYAQLTDASHDSPVRYITTEGKREFLPTNINYSGTPIVKLFLLLEHEGQTHQWLETCERWTWRSVFSDDLALMRTPAPDGVTPFAVQFPVPVIVAYRPGDQRAWLVGIPENVFPVVSFSNPELG